MLGKITCYILILVKGVDFKVNFLIMLIKTTIPTYLNCLEICPLILLPSVPVPTPAAVPLLTPEAGLLSVLLLLHEDDLPVPRLKELSSFKVRHFYIHTSIYWTLS